MSPPVWRPGRDFWFCLAIIWSPSWVISFLAMKFIKKTTGLVVVSLISTLAFSWSASIFVLSKFYHRWRRNQDTNRFFTGYESAGKTIGFTLLFFGNVGLYYFSEKSVACMLTFLFLAFYCLCFLLCIQPYTDFGVLDFLLSGSLNQTLHVFGFRSPYSWLVIIVCIVIAGIRYGLEPAHPSGQATSDEVQLEEGRRSVPPKLTKDQESTTMSSVSTVLPPGSTKTMDVPPEETNLSPDSSPLQVATVSSENIPPESTTTSSVSDLPPGFNEKSKVQTVPPELNKARDDAIHLNHAFEESTTMSSVSTVLPPGSTKTMDVPPEETYLSPDSAPLQLATVSSENIPLESTTTSSVNDLPPGLNEKSKVQTVPPELNKAQYDAIHLNHAFEESTTMSSVSTVLSPRLTETTDVLPEETNLSVESAPFQVTMVSSENIPSESTTMSSVSDLPPRLNETSEVQTVPAELSKARDDAIHLHHAFEENMSILPLESTEAQEDAVQLHRGFEGWGWNAPTIVKILAHRSATQRALIRQEYKTMFSQDLDNILSKELKLYGDLKRAVLLWMHDPATRDAVLVRQGLTEKLTLKLNVAIEVICSRTPSQIEQLKKAYRPLFGSYLEQDIESHALGDNKKLLLAYVSKSRSEGPEVDKMMVDRDAKALFKDGEYKLGTNEETFIRIFSEKSWAHLAAVNAAYRSMYRNSLRKAIKNETSWNFKYALLTILQCAKNPAKYFAKVLHKAMVGLGTDEKTLSRIIVSRAEIDIQQIKAEYLKKYRKSLSDEVHSETSGNYRAFLLSLLDTNN